MDITAGAAAAQTSEILLFKYLEDGGEITNAICIAMKTSVTRGGMNVEAAKDLLGRIPSSFKAPSWGAPLARSKFHVKIENYPNHLIMRKKWNQKVAGTIVSRINYMYDLHMYEHLCSHTCAMCAGKRILFDVDNVLKLFL